MNISPAFCMQKSFVCDDEIATVGTINLDYRSLYLHFECGVWLYRSEAVLQIKEDALSIFGQCREIRWEDWGESQSADPIFPVGSALVCPASVKPIIR